MHWWQGAFGSSSKSNSIDDTDVRYSAKPGFLSSRWNRRLQRARKLRYITGNDDNSASRSSSVTPQPLPLPELQELLQRDPKFSKNKAPLPSPRDAVQITRDRGGNEERDKDTIVNGDVVDGVDVLNRLGPDPRANVEHPKTRPSRKTQHKRSENRRSPENISIPTSDPSSPYSSLSPSPRTSDFTQYMIPPGVFQVWSAPEMPHSDRNPGVFQVWSAPELPHSDRNLSPGFYYQFPSEKSASSMDNSPLQSPVLSSNTPATSPRRSVSPMNTRLTSDMPMVRRESNAQAAVPLPLPPGAGMFSQPTPLSAVSDFSGASTPLQSTPISLHEAKPEFLVANISSQSAPISPCANKPELVPYKSQWQKGKLIGRGTFGSVYVASNRVTGALCAVKEVEILPDDSNSAESIRQLEQEIKVLSRLKHPNIVQYFGSEIVGDKFYIYLEYVHPGSINKFIHDHCRAITESVVRNFTRHILCGLAYLHSKKTIHRDIKGANLLVDAYGVVKLADFGMAKHIPASEAESLPEFLRVTLETIFEIEDDVLSLNGQAANLSLKGSPYWLAPELLQCSRQKDTSTDIALAVDIWSLGCTIIEMINGKPPWSEYEGAAALFKVLQETPPIPEKLSAEGKDFLQCCFRRKPADRPTASQLLDHPFLNNSLHGDACTQSLKEIRLSETIQFLKDRLNSKKGTMDNSFSFRHDSFSPVEQANRKISKHLI